MHIQEREQLSQFLQQLAQAQAGPKDAEAQALIDSAVARQPDAAYLLVQRSLLQDSALQAAQAQIASLQAALQQAQPAPRFLDGNAWGRAPVAPAYAPAPPVAQAPAYPQAPVAAAPSRFQAPSFLTSMATTAAGVAAGAFLFQGIESLLGHRGAGSQALAGAAGLGDGAGGVNASAFGLSEPGSPSTPLSALDSRDAGADAFSLEDSLDSGGAGPDSDDWA